MPVYRIIENKDAWTPSYEVKRVTDEGEAKRFCEFFNRHPERCNGAKYSYEEIKNV